MVEEKKKVSREESDYVRDFLLERAWRALRYKEKERLEMKGCLRVNEKLRGFNYRESVWIISFQLARLILVCVWQFGIFFYWKKKDINLHYFEYILINLISNNFYKAKACSEMFRKLGLQAGISG